MPKKLANVPNQPLLDAIEASRFRNVNRLTRYLGFPHNSLNRYVRLQRHPVDAKGYVKTDIAAVCVALGADLPELFPDGFLGEDSYRFREDYPPGHIMTNPGKPMTRRFSGGRQLLPDQAMAFLDLVEIKQMVPTGKRHEFIHAVIQRLTDDEFAVLLHCHVNGGNPAVFADDRGMTPQAATKLRKKAVRVMNSPKNLKLLQTLGR